MQPSLQIERQTDPEDTRQKIALVPELGLSLTPVLLEIAAWGAARDPATGAPDGFAEAFYAGREGYYRDLRERIAKLFARQQ
ncbi:MAG: hypothetical protein ACR2QZ_12940 [Woeseiaceae bacterium]